MKPLTLILAFSPLIVFSLLSRLLPHGDIGIAGLAAALVALAVILTSPSGRRRFSTPVPSYCSP